MPLRRQTDSLARRWNMLWRWRAIARVRIAMSAAYSDDCRSAACSAGIVVAAAGSVSEARRRGAPSRRPRSASDLLAVRPTLHTGRHRNSGTQPDSRAQRGADRRLVSSQASASTPASSSSASTRTAPCRTRRAPRDVAWYTSPHIPDGAATPSSPATSTTSTTARRSSGTWDLEMGDEIKIVWRTARLLLPDVTAAFTAETRRCRKSSGQPTPKWSPSSPATAPSTRGPANTTSASSSGPSGRRRRPPRNDRHRPATKSRRPILCYNGSGEVAERLNAALSKSVVGLRPPGVRIPPSPPLHTTTGASATASLETRPTRSESCHPTPG